MNLSERFEPEVGITAAYSDGQAIVSELAPDAADRLIEARRTVHQGIVMQRQRTDREGLEATIQDVKRWPRLFGQVGG